MNNCDFLGAGPDPILQRKLLKKLRKKYNENVNVNYFKDLIN